MNKENVSISDQLHFFLSIVKKDINHYQNQQSIISEWLLSSKQCLNDAELDLLEELQEEYDSKICLQNEIMKEFQSTLLKANGIKLKKVSEC